MPLRPSRRIRSLPQVLARLAGSTGSASLLALLVVLVATGAQAQAPAPAAPLPAATPPSAPGGPPRDARLTFSLGLLGSKQAEPGWTALEVLVEHLSPLTQEAELAIEFSLAGGTEPVWTAVRRVTLTSGLPSKPSRRREWFRVPLRQGANRLSAKLVTGSHSAPTALLGVTQFNLDLQERSKLRRSVVFVSNKPTRAQDCLDLLLPVEAGYSEASRLVFPSRGRVIAPRVVRGRTTGEVRVELRTPEELPPLRLGYRNLALLVLHATDLSRSSSAQREALLSWVETGGNVLLIPSKGRGWFKSTGISTLLEGRKVLHHGVDRLPNLERTYGPLVRAPSPRSNFEVFQLPDAEESPLATLTQSALGDLSERLRFGRTYPFLQGFRRGRGRVFMLAIDPTLPPLLSWRGRAGLLRDLEPRLEACSTLARQPDASEQDLYVDRKLFKLLDSNQRPPSEVVVGVLILYLLFVGPLNVWLLRKTGRQPIALAVSVPLCALGFTLLVLLAGFMTKGLGSVVWRGTLVETVQGSRRGRAELALSLRTSTATSYTVQVSEGASLLRVARVKAGISPQVVRAEAGQVHEGVRLDTWEQGLFVGQGEVALEGGVFAKHQGETWVAQNRSALPWARVAVLGPDLRIYTGGACAPGESLRLERGDRVSARQAAGEVLAEALFDSRNERKVAGGLLGRATATRALRLPGPCLVVRLASSPFQIQVGEEQGAQLDVPLLVAPAAVWGGR